MNLHLCMTWSAVSMHERKRILQLVSKVKVGSYSSTMKNTNKLVVCWPPVFSSQTDV